MAKSTGRQDIKITLTLEGDKSDVEMFLETIYSLNGTYPYDDVKITEEEL